MTRREARRLIKRISQKADWIDDAMDLLEKLISKQERTFASDLVTEMIKQLESENGSLLRNAHNRRVVSRLNSITESLKSTTFKSVIESIFKDVSHIIMENSVYYGRISGNNKMFKPTAEIIENLALSRLGFKSNGSLVRDGYMQGLFDSSEVTVKIKDFITRSIYTRSGFESFKTGLSEMIEGAEGKMGAFSRFYRNYAYDTYSQVDAMQGKMFSEELDLKYFIYNGGIIKNSRAFCIRKNGRVFSTYDAKSWAEEPDNTAKPPGYEPLIHRGGYGCRHSIDYITEDMAKALGYGQEPTVYKPFALKRFANGGEIITSDLVNVNLPDYQRVFSTANAFARMGNKVEILPKLDDFENPLYRQVYGDLIGTKYERKNPDLRIDGEYYEHEGYESNNPKKAFKNMINRGQKQSSRIIIDDIMLTDRYMKRNLFDRVNSEGQDIDEVWILLRNSVRQLYRK